MQDCSSLYQKIGDEFQLGRLVSIETIQILWSGYGELVRVKFPKNSIIIKHIKLPQPSSHPRGWNTDFSHKRKLHSYQVEVNWYKNFSKTIDENCRMPQGLKCFQTNEEFLIVMEDLASVGFTSVISYAYKTHLKACLSWLANFHGKYMGVKSDIIWETGTYWHLDTRPDEFELLEDKQLKDYAKTIDKVLQNTKYQTIVHGDAKLANFCFNIQGTSCAAVDFQYVGHGCGMKDIAYFMSSAIDPEACEQNEEWILDTYFDALELALKNYKKEIDIEKLEEEWRPLFSVAWADFQRFLKGWSPNHFKINEYSDELTTKALAYLKNKNLQKEKI
ncbi:oxidoreductase family protein [Halarcobacter sp.]|uniref:oxidoreductase family protein n=1 Tax=Halarcobacter sp. TaxID=2321133 RepID=UPI0029F55705|nr:oxidoreductase family protein [Halarcobacter sp.]